ncbi:Adenosylcobinamide-GDP ribazoletransferase [Aquamicrobium terrae]
MADEHLPGPIQDCLLCIGFFTRIPLRDRKLSRRFADALWAMPLAGLIVELAVGIVMVTTIALGLRPEISSALALASGVLVTGGLHDDGLADLADGFGGAHDRETKLTIVRNSSIGSYGVMALILSMLLRWTALWSAAGQDWACRLRHLYCGPYGIKPTFPK